MDELYNFSLTNDAAKRYIELNDALIKFHDLFIIMNVMIVQLLKRFARQITPITNAADLAELKSLWAKSILL